MAVPDLTGPTRHDPFASHASLASDPPGGTGESAGAGSDDRLSSVDAGSDDRLSGAVATVAAVFPPGWVPREDEELTEDDRWELADDPGSDLTPAQLDALMARLPAEFRDDPELANGDGAGPAAAGLLGLMPRDLAGGGGFDAGGVVDQLPPGLVLAALARDAWHGGLHSMSDDELVGLALAWRRLDSWATAGELAAIAELDRRRTIQADAAGDPRIAEHFADEVAMAMTLTGRAAAGLLDFAEALSRLPRTRAALAAGDIDRTKAYVLADELSGLTGPHAAKVEAAVLARAPQQTTGQLRGAAKRAVLAVDPAAAKKRQEKAQRDARVEVWHEPSGTASLAGRDLPPAEVLAADQRINALARRLKAVGRAGTLDQLRAQVYTALLLGRSLDDTGSSVPAPPASGPRPAGAPATKPGAAGPDYGTRRPDSTPPATKPRPAGPDYPTRRPDSTPPATKPRPAGPDYPTRRPDSTPPATKPRPAGPDYPTRRPDSTPPATKRGPSGSRSSTERPHVTRTGPHPDPADNSNAPAAGLAGAGGLRGSVNLTMPLSAWLGATDAPGEVAGFGAIPADDARALAKLLSARPGNRWCLTLTGQNGRAVAHGCALIADPGASKIRTGVTSAAPPGAPARAGPPGALTITVTPLAQGTCRHEREGPGYQPSNALRHALHVRQRTCSAPGCRRDATRCDLDHTIPYAQGGRTCECGMAPLCRRHHRAKQAQGWQLEQLSPGELVWRLPHGRMYRVEPDPYPE
jgi:hypothetical protein